jgi:hypothetical protein
LHCKFCPSYHRKILVDGISACMSMLNASSNIKIVNPTLGS